MIVTKAAVRRREIQSQLSKLLESARAVAAAPDARPAPRRWNTAIPRTNTLYPVTLAVHSGRRLYGTAALLESIVFGTVLFGLALFIVGTGSLLVDRCGRKRDILRKDVSVLTAIKAFIQSLRSVTISWEKMANATSLAQQAGSVLSIISSGAATFRAQIKRSTKLRLRHYR
jgi:hypothetical protein